jgi:hypothetical protein
MIDFTPCAPRTLTADEEEPEEGDLGSSRYSHDDWVFHERVSLTAGWLSTKELTLPVEDALERRHARARQPYEPRTALGKRLWAIRQRIVSSGVPLLSADAIDTVLAARRGQRESDE